MMSALVGPHKYQALTGTVLTGKFSLDVFKGRIYVCFNEAPTLPDPAKALLGNYIKDEWVGGEGKNDKACTIRNLARIAVTTNRMDFNINMKNLPVGSQERALYYVRCWDVASLNVSVAEAIKYGTALQIFQEMTLVAPTPAYELTASDFGEIDPSLFALPDYLKLKR
jgi:hypothetical protein